MIIYDKQLKEGLLEFGIEILIHQSRAARAFEKLKNHEILGPKIDRWLISRIDETITREDLLRVHSAGLRDRRGIRGAFMECGLAIHRVGAAGHPAFDIALKFSYAH